MTNISQFLLILGLIVHPNNAQAYSQYLLEVLETKFGTQHPVIRCDATGANFGASVLEFSFTSKSVGCAVFAEPRNACTPPVLLRPINDTFCDTYFAVVSRGSCTFSEKAYNVQKAVPIGFDAIIIYNNISQGAPIPMTGSIHADDVDIPVVMINYACMKQVMGPYRAEKGYTVTMKESPGYYDLIKYLVPFVVIVGFCFIILFISLVVRLCRERRRLARKRLSRANLKKIPVQKYKKGEGGPETCAICLEDFQENEKIRMLLCRHAYHQKCIDPWLTKNRKVCPICKRKVGPSNGSDSSDSETERNASNSVPSTSRDSDPLLNNAVYNSSNTEPATAATTRPSVLNIRWLPLANHQNTATTQPSAQLPHSAPLPNSTSSANLVNSDSQPSDESNSRRSAIMQRVGGAFSRAVSSIRHLTGRNSNAHRRLENDADSLSTTILESDVENPATGNRFDNNGYASTPNADENSLTTIHSNQYYVQAEVEPVPEHRN